jgi:signal transduction histidine kinase/CheY-like chemotaxis protein
MKLKILYYFLIPLMLVLIGFLFFRSMSAFVSMRQHQQGSMDLVVLERIGVLTEKAAEEEFESARYFGIKGVNYLDRLEASRVQVDKAVKALKERIRFTNTQLIDSQSVDQFSSLLKTIRTNVDTLDPACEKKFNSPDEQEPIDTLLKQVNFQNEAFLGSGIQNEIAVYVQMLYDMKALADERALLAFFLAKHSRLSDQNMATWESVLEGKHTALLPKSTTIISWIDALEKERNYITVQERLSAIRGDIFEHADNTEFSTRLYELESVFLEPIRSIHRAEAQLLKTMSQSLQQGKKENQSAFIQYLMMAFLLLLVLVATLKMLVSTKREKLALKESLKEIASDLDVERRKELETIMNQGDRVAVYHFLAKTTMEARAAEERALQAEKAKDLFLANMSHEIRTPLNGILGFTQLMQSTPLNAEQEEFMGVIEGSSDNLLKIVNDILDLSKIHAEKIELESIPFSVVSHLEKAIEPHAARALERGIEYSTFIDPTLPMVNGDPTKLAQVMTNLIGNAVKFTNDGGTVDVDVRKIKESDDIVTIRFSIKDSGIGISPEQKEKIFEPFSQADSSTTREFGGTGLGLTITRDIIDHMGGALEVMSEPGRGSEFFFELLFEREKDDADIHDKLEGVHLAYYHAGQSTLRQMERNLALYARASGARFRMVSDHELDLLDDVDVLLLDYTDKATRTNIEKLLWLGKKTILISTATQKHETDNLSSRVERIIYRPLTASKLIRAYESIFSIAQIEDEEEETQIDIVLDGLNILVAEDNPINQKLIGRVLEGMGIIATLVNNGKEALEMRIAQTFDAILMDIQMPVMGGIESTQEILRYEYSHGEPHIPIIALTANALQGDRERYMKEGFDNYISKPVNLDQLRQVLQQHCHKPEEETAQTIPKPSSDGKIDLDFFNLRTVVMYSVSNIVVQRIHQDALSYAGHIFSTVNRETDLLNFLEKKHPDYVLLDTYSIELHDCALLEKIQRTGAKLFLYGSLNAHLSCEERHVTEYTSVASLLRELH